MDQICTQTFGLKKAFSQDLIGTIEKLHALGFDGIEPFVMFNAQQGKLPKNLWALDTLKAAKEKMDELGMTIPSAHMGVAFGWFSVPVKTVVSNVRMLHENYGIRDFVMSTTFGSVAQAKHWARVCKKIADGIRPYGCRVLYHNHDDEFRKVTYKGKTVDAMEVFLEQTGDDVLLQLDIGWAGIAGDEQATVKKYAHRIASLHLKDFYSDYRGGKYNRRNMPTEAFAAIGEGTIATGQILAIRQQLPDFTGSIIIDQDKSAGDMLKDVETGIGNVRTML